MATETLSRQYLSVIENYESLIQHLEVNEISKRLLTLKYKSKRWLPPHVNPSEDSLVNQVLERIKLDPNTYDVFIAMLREIAGTDNIIQALTGKVPLIYIIIHM